MALEDRIRLPNLNLIHRRPRLLNMLEKFIEDGQRLITIYAPGGYGKSILLADFAQTTDLPVCWCSLEPADRDPTVFLTLLAHSITDRFHEIEPDGLRKLVERGDTQNSIRRIADLLSGVGPHVIIIDDYHKAVSAGMTLALNRLLDQLPETGTLIVAARGDMTLETAQILDLLLTERATGLSEEELRFTREEVRLVMRKRFGRQIDLNQAADIAQATNGNIAQILLSGHVMHADHLMGRLQRRLGDDQEIIYDYLAAEVFDKQSPELQQFLLHTAILPEMTPELCNALLDITDAQAYLEQLVYKDLFITQVGAAFRYHDLFAEFLQAKLAKDKALHRQVMLKAAHLLAQQSRFEESVSLYLAAQAWDEAAALLETKGRAFYDTGRVLTLNQWFGCLPEQELRRRPRLLLLRGTTLVYDLGQPEEAMRLFQCAEEQFSKYGDLIGAAEAQIFQSSVFEKVGQTKNGLALANQALAQLKNLKSDDQVMAWAISQRGHLYWTAGNTTEALSDFRQALELFEDLDDQYRLGICHHDIGICLDKQGNIHGAAYHFRQAVTIWEALGSANELANTLNSLGVSLHNIGRYEEALSYLNDALDIALRIGAIRYAAFVQASIGDTYLECQDYAQALQVYASSTELAQQANIRSLEIYNQIKVGECFYQQRDMDQAFRLASQAREVAAETELMFETGLACALQGKIYVYRAEYSASFKLFAEAMTCFANSDVLELAKVRLWWGYSLFLDQRISAAFEQLQEAISLILRMDDLMHGLGPTVTSTHPLHHFFLHRRNTPDSLKDNLHLLLQQSRDRIALAKPSLQVFTFGPPTLIVAGMRRQFHQRGRMRILPEFLAYLLIEGQSTGCRWSEVSAALWAELGAGRASTLFHQNLKSLRDTIFGAPDYIVVQDDYYQVNPDYVEWCDALVFEKLFERAAKAAPPEALALQLELVDLYQGEFLGGFELTEWGMSYRASYEARFFQVLEQAAEQLLKVDRAEEALMVINKGLAVDYFREALHRLAFRAYTRLNLYDHLAGHYAELCRIFDQEFGASPDLATRQLYEQLVAER
jgi:tetratricopeptide (TPR) repeat protein/DNA-binding SARP family transcriptional activator